MDITIAKNMKMPPKHGAKYPWAKLKVGECFEVQGRSSGVTLCRQANEAHQPKRFESRTISGKCWIWRTK